MERAEDDAVVDLAVGDGSAVRVDRGDCAQRPVAQPEHGHLLAAEGVGAALARGMSPTRPSRYATPVPVCVVAVTTSLRGGLGSVLGDLWQDLNGSEVGTGRESAALALLPRVDVGVDVVLHRRVQALGDALAVVDDDRPDLLQADPRDEVVGALQPLAVLAVVLEEPAGEELGRPGVVDGAEQVALADVGARRTADVDLPAAARWRRSRRP